MTGSGAVRALHSGARYFGAAGGLVKKMSHGENFAY
jgi:hypothetical protein